MLHEVLLALLGCTGDIFVNGPIIRYPRAGEEPATCVPTRGSFSSVVRSLLFFPCSWDFGGTKHPRARCRDPAPSSGPRDADDDDDDEEDDFEGADASIIVDPAITFLDQPEVDILNRLARWPPPFSPVCSPISPRSRSRGQPASLPAPPHGTKANPPHRKVQLGHYFRVLERFVGLETLSASNTAPHGRRCSLCASSLPAARSAARQGRGRAPPPERAACPAGTAPRWLAASTRCWKAIVMLSWGWSTDCCPARWRQARPPWPPR